MALYFIRFLSVHDYMLQVVFSGVDGPWKVKHPLQVTFFSLFLLYIFIVLYWPFPLILYLCFLFLSLTVLDTAAGVWLDRNGIVSSSRSNKGHDYDPSLELMRRCRHAAAAVGVHIFIYGGLRGGKYLHYERCSCNCSSKSLF